jgi:hypothetical protein
MYEKVDDKIKDFLEFASMQEMVTATTTRNTSKYDSDSLETYLNNPYSYHENLRQASDYFYYTNGLYKNIINAYSTIATLDFMITPSPKTITKMQDKSYGQYLDKVNAYTDSINIKTTTRSILKSVARYGGYVGYERSSSNEFTVQTLPLDYCRIKGKIGHDWLIDFNFKYFDKFFQKEDLDFAWTMYPPEFKKLYNKYKSDNKSRSPEWQTLDYKKTFCVLQDDDDPYFIPIFCGMFESLLNNADFKDLVKAEQVLDTTKLVVQKLPLDKDNNITIPKDVSTAIHKALIKTLPENVNGITTPFEIKDVSFSGASKTKEDLLKQAERGAFVDSGWSSAMFSDGSGIAGLNMNIEVVTSTIYATLEKIEQLFSRKFKNIVNTKTYEFYLKFFRTTNINIDESFNRMYKLLEIGGSIMPLFSIAGFDPESYMAMLQVERDLGVKDLLTPVQSIHTTSGTTDGAGAPEVADNKVKNDSTAKSKERDSNNPTNRS